MTTKHFISSTSHPTWNAHHPELRKLLGLKDKAKLPADGLPPQEIQGFSVWIEPANGTHVLNQRHHPRGRPHRVLAECPHCKQVLSAGRLHQHTCKEQA